MKTFFIISLFSTGAFFLSNYFSWSPVDSISEEALKGKEVWEKNNCISCHTIFGNGGYEGEDMTHIVTKQSKEEFREFFRNPPYMRPNIMKVHPGLNGQDTDCLWLYFDYLNSIPTLGWPPEPKKPEEGI